MDDLGQTREADTEETLSEAEIKRRVLLVLEGICQGILFVLIFPVPTDSIGSFCAPCGLTKKQVTVFAVYVLRLSHAVREQSAPVWFDCLSFPVFVVSRLNRASSG